MSASTVLNQLCVYFGGAYDYDSRSYRSPRVDGLGTVRRAFSKRVDHVDYTLDDIADNGALMVVQLSHGDERRVAFGGATSGVKRRHFQADFHVFVRSTAAFAEDAHDFTLDLLDAIIARVHLDRTCGSGGFENGGFQVGEGDAPGFEWDLAPAETAAELTKLYLHITTDVLEYVQA